MKHKYQIIAIGLVFILAWLTIPQIWKLHGPTGLKYHGIKSFWQRFIPVHMPTTYNNVTVNVEYATNITHIVPDKQVKKVHQLSQQHSLKVNTSIDMFRDQMLILKSQLQSTRNYYQFVTNQTTKVPNIFHFTWLFAPITKEFDFVRFMSVISVFNKHGPDEAFFWYETLPSGKWWNKLLGIVKKRQLKLKLMHVKSPSNVYGKDYGFGAHKADIVSIVIIQVFGGIYIDLDVLILKSLQPLMNYDFTMGEETSSGLNHGLMMSVPNATFLSLWLQNYKNHYDPKCWGCNAIIAPKTISNKHPSIIHVERLSLHHPNWAQLTYIYGKGKYYDWSNNYSMHLWVRIWPEEYKVYSIEEIKQLNSTLGQTMRWIWFNTTEIIL